MNIKLLNKNATMPTYATKGAAGLDLYVAKDSNITARVKLVSTQVAVAIPTGMVGLLCLRSSLCLQGVRLANGVGVIDSDYRGEIKIPLVLDALAVSINLEKGERVAQLVLVPYVQQTLDIVKDLDATVRGRGGFGSTNCKFAGYQRFTCKVHTEGDDMQVNPADCALGDCS